MTRLVIFDLDGTLLNTIDDLCRSVNFALNSEGLHERSLDEVRSFVGNGIRKLIERSVPQGTDIDTEERVFSVFKAHYSSHSMVSTVPYGGIDELLRALKSRGILLGVVTNKADGPAKALMAHFFPDTFDSVVGERENVRKKPAPDSVLETVQVLGCDLGDTVYIGDSEVDFYTAENAGCGCVLVSWGYRTREMLEGFGVPVADSTAELLDKLIDLGGEAI